MKQTTPTPMKLQLRCELEVAALSWGPESGDPDSPPLVAVHGWVDNAGSFTRLAPMLVEELGVRVVCIDLPGHGQSEWKPPSAEYHYVDWVAILADVLDAGGWDTAMLLGHSMGAGICGLFAGAVPDRVERLVMCEGIGPYATAPKDAVANLGRAIDGRRVHFDRTPRRMDSVDAAVERKLAALPYLDEASARALVERGTRSVDGGVEFSHDPRLTARSLLRFTEEHVQALLGSVTAPALVLVAEDGLQYPDDGGDPEGRIAALRGAEVVRVPGHHHVHLTDPEVVLDPIVEFLGR